MQPHSDNGIHHLLHSYVSFKGISIKLRCSVFHLLTPACPSELNSRVIFPQESSQTLPSPPPHRLLVMLLFYTFTVPSASLYFSTCYTVSHKESDTVVTEHTHILCYIRLSVCHFLVYCPLRLKSSQGQKTTLPRGQQEAQTQQVLNAYLFNEQSSFIPFQEMSMMKTTDAFLSYVKSTNIHTFTHALSPTNVYSWRLFLILSMQMGKRKKLACINWLLYTLFH